MVKATPGSLGPGTKTKAILLVPWAVGMFPDPCRVCTPTPPPPPGQKPSFFHPPLLGKSPVFQEYVLSMPGKVSCDLGHKSLGQEVSSNG